MSTVLWANYLSDGVVISDESDKYALYKHLNKIDGLCESNGLMKLSGFCDHTDLRFNMDEIELPEGMKSTNELMAQQGVWIDGVEALNLLQQLLAAIRANKTKFGLLRNDHDNVTAELEESIVFAKAAADKNAKFNFAVVM
jgi:hypothetical protein